MDVVSVSPDLGYFYDVAETKQNRLQLLCQ